MKPSMCGDNEVNVTKCSDCDALETRVTNLEEKVEECCTEVKETLAEHTTELTDLNDDLSALTEEVRSLTGLQVVQVEELPETGQKNTIYLVPNGTANDMYMYIDNEWVLVGDTSVDMSAYVKTEDLLDTVYPVGSIYMSVNDVSPQTFLGGTWERLGNRFLLGAGSSYTAGSTGGSPYLQDHKHDFTGGYHSHAAAYDQAFMRYNQGAIGAGVQERNVAAGASGNYKAPVVHSADVDFSYIERTASEQVTGSVGAVSNVTTGQAGNMPPYLVVYMWKRTA